MANSNSTWRADVKNAQGRVDPNVLPEYTLLPASPVQSAVSYNDLEAGTVPSDAGSSVPNPNPTPNQNANADAAGAKTCCTESLNIFKLLYMGLIAIVIPPIFCFLVGLVTGAMILYGCGRILEAIGRALAFVPEVVYREWLAERADTFLRAVRASGGAQEGVQVQVQVQEEIVEGQVALDDVEAGQGGPISI